MQNIAVATNASKKRLCCCYNSMPKGEIVFGGIAAMKERAL